MKTNMRAIGDDRPIIPKKVSISRARTELPKLIQSLGEKPNTVFEVDKHDTPLALLLSFETYNPIIQALKQGDLSPILAALIMNKWLDIDSVPSHISKPQLEELKTMDQPQLLTLLQETPCDAISDIENINSLNRKVVNRLIGRRKIALALEEAEKGGLYEVSEHLSGAH